MCLITDDKKEHTCRKDKVVYKILTREFESMNRSLRYKRGILYETIIRFMGSSVDGVYLGRYKCADFYEKKYLTSVYPSWADGNENLIYIGEGFHSYASIKRMHKSYKDYDELYVECVIPKGSKYYKSATGLLVSNRIVVKKELVDPEYGMLWSSSKDCMVVRTKQGYTQV